jgi:hypothetical protein
MVWSREVSVEVTENSPLNETTGVSERKPTSRITGTRRPDNREAFGSRPLQIERLQTTSGWAMCPGKKEVLPEEAAL